MTLGIFGKSLVWRHTAEPAARERPLGVDQKQSPNIAMKYAEIERQDCRTELLSFFHTWSIRLLMNLKFI